MKRREGLQQLVSRRQVIKLLGGMAALPLLGSEGARAQAPNQTLNLGVLFPLPTGNKTDTDLPGTGALAGALLADSLHYPELAEAGLTPKLLPASTPTPEAAARLRNAFLFSITRR